MYLAEIRQEVQQILRDETGATWKPDALDIHIRQVTDEIAEAIPYIVRESVTLTAQSLEASTTSITNLIEVMYAEYPVGKTPRRLHNVTELYRGQLLIESDSKPSGSETAYLYCEKHHTLDEDSTTLSRAEERLLVLGVSAKAAISQSGSRINKVNKGGGRVPEQRQSWANDKLAEYRAALRDATPQRVSMPLPRSGGGSDLW